MDKQTLKSQSFDHLLMLIESLQYSNSELAYHNEKLRKQIVHKDKLSKSEINLLLEENTRILCQNNKLSTTIQKLHAKLSGKQDTVAMLKAKSIQFQQNLNEVQNQYGKYFTEMSQLKHKNNQLSHKIVKLKQDLKQKNIRIQYLQNQLEFRRKQLNNTNLQIVNKRTTSAHKNISRPLSPPHSLQKTKQRSKSRQIPKTKYQKQYEAIKGQIQCTIATLDEMNLFTQYQQTSIKQQLKTKYEQFILLKQQSQKLKQSYQKQINKLKEQNQMLRQQLNKLTHTRRSTVDNDDLQTISKCFEHGLPYIKSLKQEFPKDLSQIIQNIEAMFIEIQRLNNQSEPSLHFDVSPYTLEIDRLNNQIMYMKQEQNINSEKLGQQFMQLQEQRLKIIQSLELKTKQQAEIIQSLSSEKEAILTKIYNTNKLQDISYQSQTTNIEGLLEINEQNTFLKMKNYEAFGMIEGLLHILSNIILQLELKTRMNEYYRICQKQYWKVRQAVLFNKPKKISSGITKLKKVCKSIFFISILKVSQNKRSINQKLSISDFNKSTTNQRFLNLLVKHSDFNERQQNKALQQFKSKQNINIFQELVSMMNIEMNIRTIESLNLSPVGWVLFNNESNRISDKISVNRAGMFRKTKYSRQQYD